jgi:S1-C subfamily serine protease
MVDMVETDAPISAGSSGGALVDDGGAVVAITTVPAVDSGNNGLGFAIPIDTARTLAEEIISTGKVTHVWLGVEGSDLDGAQAGDLNLDGGAMVTQVTSGSPAQAAGLTPNDVIVAVDGVPVHSMSELVLALRGRAPGEPVTIDLMRDRQHKTMVATLAPRPGS